VNASELARQRTVNLTTIGRKTGKPSTVEIWWFEFEDRLLVTGTPGPRDWLANIRSDPNVIVSHRIGDLTGSATVVDDPEFRRRFFMSNEPRWYRGQAQLDALVAEAPMVELHLTERKPPPHR
jgi:deazaflavin-dependent oxidoreductase (nitroreductase family)